MSLKITLFIRIPDIVYSFYKTQFYIKLNNIIKSSENFISKIEKKKWTQNILLETKIREVFTQIESKPLV